MYNKNYFPTPAAIINQMIEPYSDLIKTAAILEPSAGMGAICDAVKYRSRFSESRIFCCEIDENMQATLKGKGYKVLQSDFLEYSGAMNFDLILMNPPFDRGCEHLLHAFKIMRSGHICCLLNEETIKNPYTNTRQELADIIAKNGTVEFIGEAFQSADRKTNVGVALVRLEKKSDQSTATFNMKATEAAQDIDLSSESGSVERADYVDALIRSYSAAVSVTESLYRAMKEFQLYTSVFITETTAAKHCATFFDSSQRHGYSHAHNEFVMALQRGAWDTIFSKTRASGMMTTKVRDKFNKWREDQGGADLNRENISMFFDALIQQRAVISNECVVEAFDNITQYSEKNRTVFSEKWKTNSAYMVAEKFILPHIVDTSWGYLRLSHGRYGEDVLNDIDRALCMISGKNFEDIEKTRTTTAIRNWCSDKLQPEESEFFTFKCYQKGSAHFKFKNESVREQFNRAACAAKGWQLPEQEFFHGKARRK